MFSSVVAQATNVTRWCLFSAKLNFSPGFTIATLSFPESKPARAPAFVIHRVLTSSSSSFSTVIISFALGKSCLLQTIKKGTRPRANTASASRLYRYSATSFRDFWMVTESMTNTTPAARLLFFCHIFVTNLFMTWDVNKSETP
uniref:Uncharacterized protein n=1 Tax=Schistocephalus solidus TaxID=70667 RepID=A0A0X3NV26_SCHSO